MCVPEGPSVWHRYGPVHGGDQALLPSSAREARQGVGGVKAARAPQVSPPLQPRPVPQLRATLGASARLRVRLGGGVQGPHLGLSACSCCRKVLSCCCWARSPEAAFCWRAHWAYCRLQDQGGVARRGPQAEPPPGRSRLLRTPLLALAQPGQPQGKRRGLPVDELKQLLVLELLVDGGGRQLLLLLQALLVHVPLGRREVSQDRTLPTKSPGRG